MNARQTKQNNYDTDRAAPMGKYRPLSDVKTAHGGRKYPAKFVRDDRSVTPHNFPDGYEIEKERAMEGMRNLHTVRDPMKKGFTARKNPFAVRMWR